MNYRINLSVVIPTHNRSTVLQKSLDALFHQAGLDTKFEVIVVADSCTDDTEARVKANALRMPFPLRLFAHSAGSAAATRNLGAAQARGKILLFLDDDIVPQPGFLQAHIAAQQENRIVLGYSKPVLPARPSWWQYDARRWWEDTYSAMREPGHRFSYRDFFSGNVSLSASLFQKAGGFNTTFRGRLEDYELGWRLLKAGGRFCFVPDALGYHYDMTDLALWLHRIRQEGIAHIQIGQHHPELRNTLFAHLAEPYNRWRHLLRKIAFAYPQHGKGIVQGLLTFVTICEQLRWRDLWRKMVGVLREYNYWCGVAEAVGGQQAFAAWLQDAPLPPSIASNAPIIDIAKSPPAETMTGLLDQATTLGLRITFEGIEILSLPPQPGLEPLQKEHLDTILRRVIQQQFVPALAFRFIRSTAGGDALYSLNWSKLI